MRKIYITALVILLSLISLRYQVSAQTSLRGIYIDGFYDDILGDPVAEDALLKYAQDSSYNYLALYQLHKVNFGSSTSVNKLVNFIKKARQNYNIPYIGAVGESWNTFANKIAPYNNSRQNADEKFNVFNLEFEFWISNSVNSTGYYCLQYLQPNNCSCDTAGAFSYYINLLNKIDSLADVQGAISETYVGWFNLGQGAQIANAADRVLLHAYRTSPSSVYGYSKNRLSYLASQGSVIEVAPIFSSEEEFMGPWLENNSQFESYDTYLDDFNADNPSWKPLINLVGYHWFDYGEMPKPDPNSAPVFNPMINASGPLTLCNGGSVTLTASAGSSFLWSTGDTTASITVDATGTYSCQATSNGQMVTTPSVNVTVNHAPTVVVTANTQSASVELEAVASAGSGTISSYQWRRNGSPVSGGNTSTYTATTSGDYTVVVTNSNGCSTTSAEMPVSIAECILTVPAPIGSSVTGNSVVLTWEPVQSADSIIVRYAVEGTGTYHYIRMPNTGQTSVVVSNLQWNKLYSWRVKTMCGSNASAYSSKKYFRTSRTAVQGPGAMHLRSIEMTVDVNEDSDLLLVYPNPVADNATLFFYSTEETGGTVTISDVQGKVFMQEHASLIEGDNQFKFNAETFPAGVYFISVKTASEVITKRMIVRR